MHEDASRRGPNRLEIEKETTHFKGRRHGTALGALLFEGHIGCRPLREIAMSKEPAPQRALPLREHAAAALGS